MSADIRIIRLIRKNIHYNSLKEELSKAMNTGFFATDYFDVMEVEQVDASDSLMTVMGVRQKETLDAGDILAQSFSLYCSERMLEEEFGVEWCSDPFTDDKFPFLSIIQVHITPNAIQRIKTENTEETEVKCITDAFYSDLHEAVSDFISGHTDMKFILRIYKMLSTGDFAVVVRSNKAEASFLLASWIRQRSTRELLEENYQLVLYKTYTLLTISGNAIQQENTDDGTAENCFILRGCYSNHYWGEKAGKKQEIAERIKWKERQICGINGRYDFSVRVTEKEFLELYPMIRKYKNGEKIDCNKDSNNRKEESEIVEYIRNLMCEGYLSYVNERYLIAQEKWKEQLNAENYTNLQFLPLQNYEELLERKIKDKYIRMERKYKETKKELDRIKEYRKNMIHYMELLHKLIMLCQCINESSDTRISAITLLDQLDVIMDSIRVYVQMYQEMKNEKMLNLLEEYIQESAWALDGYAQYIRNNNLQSIQTPNYNLETNMSMEKLLIGYGEMIEIFTKFYQELRTDKESTEEQIFPYPKKLLPIVVPAIHNHDMSVEVLFLEGVSDNWNREKDIWMQEMGKEIRHCMVVSVPALKEIMDIRIMVISLFHEIAHQLRYEYRETRNDAVLEYMIHTLMQQIAENLVDKLQQKLRIYNKEQFFSQFLGNIFTKVYLDDYYAKNDEGIRQYRFREAPFNHFKTELLRDLETNLRERIKEERVEDVLEEFLKELLSYQEEVNAECSEAITLLDELLMTTQEDCESNKTDIKEQIKKCAYILAGECAYQNLDSPGTLKKYSWDNLKLEEWVKSKKKVDGNTKEPIEFNFKGEWNKYFATHAEEKINDVIWHLFDGFATWIDGNYKPNNKEEREKLTYDKKNMEVFLQKTYECICMEWEKQETFDCYSAEAKKQAAMARMLGIDFASKDNYAIFEEEVMDVMRHSLSGLIEAIEWRIKKYREETADMLMCNALNLSPIGYIHLLAVNWPIGEVLPDQFIARCVNVFLFQWCTDEKDKKIEINEDKLEKQCEVMVEKLEEVIKMIEKKYPIPQRNIQGEDEENHKGLVRLADRLGNIEKVCKSIFEVYLDNKKEKQYFEALKIYKNMAKLMKLPIYYGKDFIQYLDDFAELKEDY